MKFAILMGRGIEGCGVTKFTLEQAKWFDKIGHEYKIFASSDKSWTRKASHDVTKIETFKLKKDAEVDRVIKEIEGYDIIIINSLPPLKLH